MRAKTYAFVAVLALTVHSSTQATLKSVYIEGFRNGPARISEQNLAAKLDSQNPHYKATIKDLEGNRYQLSPQPQKVEEGDERIVCWHKLIGPYRRYLGNLPAIKPPELLSDRPQDRACWLDPSPLRSGSPVTDWRVQGRKLRSPGEGFSRTGT